MIKIACHTLPWANYYRDKKYEIKDVLESIKKLGYDGVELVEPLTDIGKPEPFKKYLHILGLELASLSCSADSEVRNRIDFLKHFDASVAMICAGWITKTDRKEGILVQSLREDLEEIAEYAKARNINLAFHPHKDTLIETKEDLEDFYSTETPVKLCLDVAHIARCGSDPIQVLKEFRNRIVYVHLKDFDSKNKEFVEPGQGDLDLKPILEYLKDNYEGWLTVEVDVARKDPVESARISREYLKEAGL